MKRVAHVLALAVAVGLAAAFANRLAGHVAADACLDAGGRFEAAAGLCRSEGTYVSPFDRTGNVGFWLFFLVPVLAVGAGAYVVLSRLARVSRSMRPHIHAGDGMETPALELDPLERRLLERSRDRAATVRRKRLVLVAAGINTLAVWYLFEVLDSTTLAMAVFLVYIAATAVERSAYANAVLALQESSVQARRSAHEAGGGAGPRVTPTVIR